MNTSEIWLDACGIAGVILHCLFKLNSLQSDARAANVDFNWKKDYLQRDAVPILISFMSVVIWHLVFGEVAASYPKLEAFARVSFVGMGLLGSYIIQQLMGRAKSYIKKFIDVKTNISDAVTGKTKTVEETIVKGSDVLIKANENNSVGQ